jgi:DNA primase
MITKDTIDRIIEAAHVEEVVGDFVALKKRGARFIGSCPFHNEKTPSFTVTPALNIYKCFGCGAAGDSVKFLMEHEKLTYPEALRYLAGKYKIEIEETVSEKKDLEVADAKESLYSVNSFAQKFFTHYLLETEEGRSIGFSYFKERGLTKDTIRKFQLGFAPEQDNKLLQSARTSEIGFEQLQKAGLATEKNGRQLDFFRGRVMFPIHSMTGKVLAFGGRVLKKDALPKYINTPETDVYHKSQILYGIFQAKAAIRKYDECILTEGYMDVISLAQAGIDNAVASSGTSLTVEQTQLIKRLTKYVTVFYDSDAAGEKATNRGIDILLKEGLFVYVLQLPEGEDPDSYLKKYGRSNFDEYKKKNREEFVIFLADFLLKKAGNDLFKKTEALTEVYRTISIIPHGDLRGGYIKHFSNKLNITEINIVHQVNKFLRERLTKESETQKNEYRPVEEHYEPEPQDVLPNRMDFLEKDIIRLLLEFAYEPYSEDGSILDFVLAELDGDNFTFNTPVYEQILTEYRQALDRNENLPQQYFLNHAKTEISKLAMEILNKPYELSENWRKMHNIEITERSALVT